MGGSPRAVSEGLPVLSGTSLPCARGQFLPPSLASRGGRRFGRCCKRSHLLQALERLVTSARLPVLPVAPLGSGARFCGGSRQHRGAQLTAPQVWGWTPPQGFFTLGVLHGFTSPVCCSLQ